jgi:hypothetical protein
VKFPRVHALVQVSLYLIDLTFFLKEKQLGKIYVVLSDAVERKLRLAIVVRLGGKKGNLSIAVEAAIKDWLKKQ